LCENPTLLFSAIIQTPMKKSYLGFVKGTMVMRTSGLVGYKNISSLQSSAAFKCSSEVCTSQDFVVRRKCIQNTWYQN